MKAQTLIQSIEELIDIHGNVEFDDLVKSYLKKELEGINFERELENEDGEVDGLTMKKNKTIEIKFNDSNIIDVVFRGVYNLEIEDRTNDMPEDTSERFLYHEINDVINESLLTDFEIATYLD